MAQDKSVKKLSFGRPPVGPKTLACAHFCGPPVGRLGAPSLASQTSASWEGGPPPPASPSPPKLGPHYLEAWASPPHLPLFSFSLLTAYKHPSPHLFGSAPRRGLFRAPGGLGREASSLGLRGKGLLELGLTYPCQDRYRWPQGGGLACTGTKLGTPQSCFSGIPKQEGWSDAERVVQGLPLASRG